MGTTHGAEELRLCSHGLACQAGAKGPLPSGTGSVTRQGGPNSPKFLNLISNFVVKIAHAPRPPEMCQRAGSQRSRLKPFTRGGHGEYGRPPEIYKTSEYEAVR